MRRSIVSQVCVAALLLASGVLIVAQIRTQRRLAAIPYSRDDQALLLSELVDANRLLREEVAVLSAQVTGSEGERATVLEQLVDELNRARVLTGLVGVSGPGIEVRIDGPLEALDLQDLVNELRNAGAEAIALNGYRLLVSSVPTIDARGQITVNGQAIERPYRLEAIGEPDTLEAALLRSGGLIAVLERRYPALRVEIAQRAELLLNVSLARPDLAYAHPTR
ncbi:MAG: DUF881 domain-containing protein [Anaerolineae bacterium]|nr:DUF881 domain-containing protein [Anaerolineae bacterium]